jgi:hypothetical protein
MHIFRGGVDPFLATIRLAAFLAVLSRRWQGSPWVCFGHHPHEWCSADWLWFVRHECSSMKNLVVFLLIGGSWNGRNLLLPSNAPFAITSSLHHIGKYMR